MHMYFKYTCFKERQEKIIILIFIIFIYFRYISKGELVYICISFSYNF